MLSKTDKLIHRILMIIVIVFALVGSWQTLFISGELQDNDILYFTIQSNIWIALINIYFLIAEFIEERNPSFSIPPAARTLKFVFTASVTITLIVFFVLLVPELGIQVITLPGSIATHLIAPLLAIIDYIFFERKQMVKAHTGALAIVPPLIYFAVILIASSLGVTFINESPFPYFFLNYHELGWFRIADGRIGVAYWIVILCILIIGIGYGLLALNQQARKQRKRKEDDSKTTPSKK